MVVASISAIRSTCDRGVLLDRGEGVGGDEAALRLGAGDRDLDAEHLLEAGAVGQTAPISGSV
jgi:hypothetical protein